MGFFLLLKLNNISLKKVTINVDTLHMLNFMSYKTGHRTLHTQMNQKPKQIPVLIQNSYSSVPLLCKWCTLHHHKQQQICKRKLINKQRVQITLPTCYTDHLGFGIWQIKYCTFHLDCGTMSGGTSHMAPCLWLPEEDVHHL